MMTSAQERRVVEMSDGETRSRGETKNMEVEVANNNSVEEVRQPEKDPKGCETNGRQM